MSAAFDHLEVVMLKGVDTGVVIVYTEAVRRQEMHKPRIMMVAVAGVSMIATGTPPSLVGSRMRPSRVLTRRFFICR
jgi:hypothetical protein